MKVELKGHHAMTIELARRIRSGTEAYFGREYQLATALMAALDALGAAPEEVIEVPDPNRLPVGPYQIGYFTSRLYNMIESSIITRYGDFTEQQREKAEREAKKARKQLAAAIERYVDSVRPEVARIDLEDACKAICNYCREGMPLLGFVHPFDMQSLPKEWQHDIGKTRDGKDDLRDECEAGELRTLAARSPLRPKSEPLRVGVGQEGIE